MLAAIGETELLRVIHKPPRCRRAANSILARVIGDGGLIAVSNIEV